jgi:signal transduction histidine kinase
MQAIVYKNKQPLHVWVAEDIHLLNQQLLFYSIYLLILLLIVIAISIIIHQKMLDKAFKVFELIQERLQSNRYETIDVNQQETPTEIHPLLSEISLLIDQLRQRIMRTRNAIGDLSHELKRPLQLLTISIDNNKQRQTELDAISEIKMIIDRELRRAKIAGSDGIPVEFNIKQEIPYLIDVMSKIYPKINIQMENPNNIETTHLDRDDMLELIGNLLDNACKYATSKVTLSFTQKESRFILTIKDDGPGIETSKLALITRQGVRLDESKEGHGLGLRICRDIIDSYKGKLTFYSAKTAGLTVVVELNGF